MARLTLPVAEGKYTVIIGGLGTLEIQRHGKDWYVGGEAKPKNCIVAMAEELAELRKFRDAAVKVSICEMFSARLEGFTERDDSDDEEFDEAWEILASVIEPIVAAEDTKIGNHSFSED